MDDRAITLVACCKPKLGHPALARDLYLSPRFKTFRRLAEQRGRWFILSAKYGLVDPDTVIEPYDKTLTKMPAAERRAWGHRVRDQLAAAGLLETPLVSLAGNAYVNPLLAAGVKVSQPMKGMNRGHQLTWAKRQTKA